MTAVEGVTTEFYDMLMRLGYPGMALVNSKDIEKTILGREERVFLLSWLLKRCSNDSAEEFSGEDARDEEKLVKWYTNVGVCKSPEALLGKVSMSEQVTTLRNLLFFVENMLAADEPLLQDFSLVVDIVKSHLGKNINIIPAGCKLGSTLKYGKAVQYLEEREKTVSEMRQSTGEVPLPIESSESIVEPIDSVSNNPEVTQEVNVAGAVKKFDEAFDLASFSKTLDNQLPSHSTKSMDGPVHATQCAMSIFKESVHAKDQVSSFGIPDILKKRQLPLNGVIEDAVIRIEELKNLYDLK